MIHDFIKTLGRKIRVVFCHHGFFFEDIEIMERGTADQYVTGCCHKCRGIFTADYGLALPGSIDGYRRDWHV